MARDDAPKVRQQKQLARKRAHRASYDRILIVSEGSKTEPSYFREIQKEYRLHSTNVTVRPSELGTAPVQVVTYAKELFENGDHHKNIQRRAFEQIYAVFDRDDHESYFEALNLAKSLDGSLRSDNGESVKFRAIASVPSFELWLLLHYEDVHAPIRRNEVLNRLRRHMLDYKKGMSNAFALTRGQLELANQRARSLSTRFDGHTAPEPYTGVFELVSLLTTLGKS